MFIEVNTIEFVKGQYKGDWILVNKEYYCANTAENKFNIEHAEVIKCAPKTSAAGFKHLNPIKYYESSYEYADIQAEIKNEINDPFDSFDESVYTNHENAHIPVRFR